MKALEQLEDEVKQFNILYKIGDKVNLKIGHKVVGATIKEEASILQGHSAVVWFEEYASCYSCDSVKGINYEP